MEETSRQPSLLKRVLAIAVLICVGLFVLKLLAGFVVGLVVTIFWIGVVVLLIGALVWAFKNL